MQQAMMDWGQQGAIPSISGFFLVGDMDQVSKYF